MSKRIAREGRVSALILTAAAAVFTFSTHQALSQTASLGTSAQGTSNNALSTALGKVVNEHTGLKVRVVPMGGPEQYAPAINSGRMDMAIASSTDVQFAYDGTVTFKGRPQENLRFVASLYPFRVAFFVKKDSPIKTISDLKGKRVPIKFSNQKAAHRHYLAAIAAAGLTEDDFDGVPVPNVVSAAQDFVQGKLDASWFAVGAGKVKEVAAQVGGIRYLPAETSPEALERMRKYAPAAFIEIAQPSK
jgi:TRAP transporter TAXI family solute receptor